MVSPRGMYYDAFLFLLKIIGKVGDIMLETNTDRFWWMIGALSVGGAAFAVLKLKYPDLLDKGLDYLLGSFPNIAGLVSGFFHLFS